MKATLVSVGAVLLVLSACSDPALHGGTAAPDTTASIVPAKPSTESLTIDFDSGAATLTPTALGQLDGASRLYRDARPEVMIVSGHSDKSGPEYANLLLSAKRAASVKGALVDRGVPAERLQIIAIGSAEPNPALPAARSVVVTWR